MTDLLLYLENPSVFILLFLSNDLRNVHIVWIQELQDWIVDTTLWYDSHKLLFTEVKNVNVLGASG